MFDALLHRPAQQVTRCIFKTSCADYLIQLFDQLGWDSLLSESSYLNIITSVSVEQTVHLMYTFYNVILFQTQILLPNILPALTWLYMKRMSLTLPMRHTCYRSAAKDLSLILHLINPLIELQDIGICSSF